MQQQIKRLHAGVHVVVGTPGRIMNHLRRETLELDSIRIVVLMARPDDKDKQRQRDIEDVIREEISRRHPIDMDAVREGLRLRDDYRSLVRGGDEKEFRDFLTALGWESDSPAFERFVRAWRAFRR